MGRLLIEAASNVTQAERTRKSSLAIQIRPGLIVLGAAVVAYLVSAGSFLQVGLIGLDLILIGVTFALIRTGRANSWLGLLWIGLIIAVLVGVKIVPIFGVGTVNAGGPALGWIGFSYLAFRLLHMVFDARLGKPNDATLGETVTYALHPASLIAGPIDRLPRSLTEQRHRSALAPRIRDGLWRVGTGVFKKLVIANSVYALITAIDMPRNPGYSAGLAWAWIIAYAFYLYFDFAGYSDMAIGAGSLIGLRLPENFANPYGQPNLTRFWTSWHISLSAWLRDYVFFPVSRILMQRTDRRHQTAIQFTAQITTMLVCGLWHGISLNFAVWGLWHGVGLFATAQIIQLWRRMGWTPLPGWAGVPIMFVYVCIGWVFFCTPDMPTALMILGRLAGL